MKRVDADFDLLKLFRPTDPATSEIAAESIIDDIPYRQYCVYHAIKKHGPLTHHELVALPELKRWVASGTRTRCRELVAMGLVRAAGLGVAPSGRPAITWDIYRSPLD